MSGGIRVVAIYAQLLRANGHEVTIVSPPPPLPSLKRRLSSFLRGPVVSSRVRQSHIDHTDIDHRVLDRYRPITDSDVPDGDVVIATWWETAEWMYNLSGTKGSKAYLIQGHEVFDGLPVDRVRETYRLPVLKIVVSNWLCDVLRSFYDQPAVIVENGVDLDQFTFVNRSKRNNPRIGFVYSNFKNKGSDLAFSATRVAKQSYPDLEVVSFGSTSPFDEHRSVLSRFWLLPPQDEIPKIYASCDFWLFSSIEEGFGLPILEAMACGTPVISTMAGAAPQIVDESSGYLVSTSTEKLSEKIVEVCGFTNDQWKRMSLASRRIAENRSWASAAGHLESVLLDYVSSEESRSTHR